MRILVTGASGGLGAYVVERLVEDGHHVVAWSGCSRGERSGILLQSVDLTDSENLIAALHRIDPFVIMHLAAISAAAECLRVPTMAQAINVDATSKIAEWCSRRGRRLIFTSTDLVFSGENAWNHEDDATEPITLYGQLKEAAELAVRTIPRGLVARMSLMFGPSKCGRPAFIDNALMEMRNGRPQTFFRDEFRTPLDYATAAKILVRLIFTETSGILHVAGDERMSRIAMMARIATTMGFDSSLVQANNRADANGPEPRPADVSLSTEKLFTLFPDLVLPTIEQVAYGWA